MSPWQSAVCFSISVSSALPSAVASLLLTWTLVIGPVYEICGGFKQIAVMWAQLLLRITHSSPTLCLISYRRRYLSISLSLSPRTRPNVNTLQGTYIWMYVEREDGTAWGEEVDNGKREGWRLKGSNQKGRAVMWPNILHTNGSAHTHLQKCLRLRRKHTYTQIQIIYRGC